MIKILKGNKTYIFPDFSCAHRPRAYVLIRTLRSWKTLTHRQTLEHTDWANSIQSVWCIFIAKTKTPTKVCKTALTTCRTWIFYIAKKFLLTNRQWQLVSRQLQYRVYKNIWPKQSLNPMISQMVSVRFARRLIRPMAVRSPRLSRFARCVFAVL